jgi:hypothetical protein
MRAMTHADDVAGLIEYARDRLLARLEGLLDDEYFWEPVAGCWSVRERDGDWHVDLGADGTRWTTDPPPLTTIAWRLWHLGATPDPDWPPRGAIAARQFIDCYFDPARRESTRGVGAAAKALDLVRENWSALPQTVHDFEDADLVSSASNSFHKCAMLSHDQNRPAKGVVGADCRGARPAGPVGAAA